MYSTNYKRTQLSAQALLEGLRAGQGGLPIRIRKSSEDHLNNFEARSAEMLGHVAAVEAHPEFAREEESRGFELKQALLQHAPAGFASGSGPAENFRYTYTWC